MVGFIHFSSHYRLLVLVGDDISFQSECSKFGKNLQYDARNVSKTILHGQIYHISLAITAYNNLQYYIHYYLYKYVSLSASVFNHHGNAIRIGIGAFSLAAFVLSHAYSSVLISFATTPIFRPLIDSVYDIPKNPRVYVTVDKDQGTDVFLRVYYDDTFL